MMTTEEVIRILEYHGTILHGHFVGTSGRHLDTYVNKDVVYTIPQIAAQLGSVLARRVPAIRDVDIVAGPAIGGAILTQWVAYYIALCGSRRPHAVFAEKDGGGFMFRRGYDRLLVGYPKPRGCRVLVVDDVLNTGGSALGVVQAVKATGGTVVGVAALVNRGGVTAELLGVPTLTTLVDLDLASWDEAECPLCRTGVPVNTEVGKGREYLVQK